MLPGRGIHAVSVRSKILAPVLLIFVAAFGVIFFGASRVLDSQRQEYSQRIGRRVSSAVSGGLYTALMSGNKARAHEVMKAILADTELPPSRIAIRSTGGGYWLSASDLPIKHPRFALSPGPGQVASREFGPANARFVNTTTSLDNATACQSCHGSSRRTLGYLEVDLPVVWARQRHDVTLTAIAAIAGLSLVLLALAVVLSVHVAVVTPIKRLTGAVAVVERGSRRVQVQPGPEDEIGILGRRFNAMVAEVAEAEHALIEKEHQLASAEKLAGIGLMAAGVAHEINNPLTAVSVAAESINLPNISAQQQHKLSASILEGARRIQNIVSELLTLDQRRTLALSSEDIEDVVREAVSLRHIPDDVQVQYRFNSGLPKITVDRERIVRALGNIIKNAVQAMPDGGDLTLSGEPVGNGMLIDVRDTGSGIDPANLQRIFDPFFSMREVGEGFGLGLAFAHAVVKQHGGDILVKSEPGKGTVFTIALPLETPRQPEGKDFLEGMPDLEEDNNNA